uniref:Late embryogenesis abundant protein n=1 Tax=Solanum tuberosum TaxID=4113 RepID=M1C4R8_SOLTU
MTFDDLRLELRVLHFLSEARKHVSERKFCATPPHSVEMSGQKSRVDNEIPYLCLNQVKNSTPDVQSYVPVYLGNVGQPMDCIKDKAQATQNLTFEMAQSAKGIAHNKITGAAHTTKDKMSRAAKAMKDKVA